MSANDRQVGGSHYKTGGEEHWDRQYRLFGPGYFIGCITKYVERYRSKNGFQDLLKAQHFLEKLIEIEGMLPQEVSPKVDDDDIRQRKYDWARNQDPDERPVEAPKAGPIPDYSRPLAGRS